MRDEIFKIYLVVYQIKKKYFMWAEERLNIKFFSYASCRKIHSFFA